MREGGGGGGRGVRLPLLCCCSVRSSGRSAVPPAGGGARRSRAAPAARPHPPAWPRSQERVGPRQGWGRRGEGGAREAPPDAHVAQGSCRSCGEPRSPIAAGQELGSGLGGNCSCSRSSSSTQSYVIEVWMRIIRQAERGNCSSAAAVPLRAGRPPERLTAPAGVGFPRSCRPARRLPGSLLRLVQPPRPQQPGISMAVPASVRKARPEPQSPVPQGLRCRGWAARQCPV